MMSSLAQRSGRSLSTERVQKQNPHPNANHNNPHPICNPIPNPYHKRNPGPNPYPNQERVQKLFNVADLDSNGAVDFGEFLLLEQKKKSRSAGAGAEADDISSSSGHIR